MKRTILNEAEVAKAIEGLADSIVKRHGSDKDLVLVGILTGGAYLAARLNHIISNLTGISPAIGNLDITLYRDDWTRIGPAPVVRRTVLPPAIDEKNVILVDDVVFTGRTVRAAMDALMDYGRPKRIELAVLVDRGESCRELPIMANYSGILCKVGPSETVNVYLKEGGAPDCVTVEERRQSRS
jgi:pyrimidine operon attenuation protein/uracil phosphoribosyltransferase